ADERRHEEAAVGDEIIEAADELDVLRRNADFLLRLAHGRRLERLPCLDGASGEGDLAAVRLQLIAAPRKEDRPIAPAIANERHEHAGAPMLRRVDLESRPPREHPAQRGEGAVVKVRQGRSSGVAWGTTR